MNFRKYDDVRFTSHDSYLRVRDINPDGTLQLSCWRTTANHVAVNPDDVELIRRPNVPDRR